MSEQEVNEEFHHIIWASYDERARAKLAHPAFIPSIVKQIRDEES
jgi:hypothetical protein